ncbi:MAG: iron-sulfur cluster assembly scaffold protein [Candidatus Helarchaeota archaeon]
MRVDDKEFDKFIDELQEEIYQEELRTFSRKVVEEYYNPKNWGKIEDANAKATIKGPCGDTQMIFLKIQNGIITDASFMTDGCGPTIACGSKLTTMVLNKSIAEAKKITPEALTEALDGLPPEHQHCALLAVNTLKKALDTFENSEEDE